VAHVKVKVFGNDNKIAWEAKDNNGPASETTLQDILAHFKGQKPTNPADQIQATKGLTQALLQKVKDNKEEVKAAQAEAKESGTASAILNATNKKLSDGFGESATAITNTVSGLGVFGSTMMKFVGPIGMVVSAFEVLRSVIAVAGQALLGPFIALGKTFLQGSDKLSDYTAAVGESLSKIPLIGGLLGSLVGVITGVISYFEDLNKQLFILSASGASFNNNLMLMRASAAATGLTLDEFAGKILANSESIAQFSTSVTNGALAFAALGRETREKFGRQLMNMGFTMSDVNDSLIDFMALNKAGAALGLTTVTQQAESAKGLMLEMDAMAKLTGQNRKAMMDELKKKQNDAAFQMKLATMDVEERNKVNASMVQMAAQFGPVGAEMVKLRVLGLPPLTKETQLFAATMGGAGQTINGITDQAMKSGQNLKDFNKDLDKATVDAVASAMASGKSMENVLAAGGAGLAGSAEALANLYKDVTVNNAKYIDRQGKFDKDKLAGAIANVRKEQTQIDSARDMMNSFTLAMQKIRDALFNNVLKPLYDGIAPTLSKLADWFESSGGGMADNLKLVGEKIGAFVENFAKDLFTDEGRQKIVNDLIYYLKLIMIEIKKAILPSWVYDSKDAARDTETLEIEKAKFDAAAKSVRDQTEIDALRKKNAEDSTKQLDEVQQKEYETRKLHLAQLEKDVIPNINNKERTADADAGRKQDLQDEQNLKYKQGLAGAGAGAVTGAAIGSIIPVLGTAIGAGIGGILGGALGYFGGGVDKDKKEDAVEPKQFSSGTLGEANKLIEDFGKGTPAMLHGNEAVMTQDQLQEFAQFAMNFGPSASDHMQKMLSGLPPLTETTKTEESKMPPEMASILDKLSSPLESAKSMIDSLTTMTQEKVSAESADGKFDKIFGAIQSLTTPTAQPANRDQEAILVTLQAMLEELRASNKISEELLQYTM